VRAFVLSGAYIIATGSDDDEIFNAEESFRVRIILMQHEMRLPRKAKLSARCHFIVRIHQREKWLLENFLIVRD